MTTYVKSYCHCGLNTFKIALDSSTLPATHYLCHCNTCRHSTGQLYIGTVLIKGVPLDINVHDDTPADLSNLGIYKSSETGSRYFCKKCFAHFFFVSDSEWYVFTGTIDTVKTKGITGPPLHAWVGDTLDGGLADHFSSYEGGKPTRFKADTGSEELPVGWRATQLSTQSSSEELPFYCQCKSIKFKLTRPKSLYFDKLQPGKKEDDPIRVLATHCVCTDCRLACGNQIHSWITIPSDILVDSDTGKVISLDDPEKRPKGLKQYESSPGKLREACETCGANVFWWIPGEKWLDISVGLVDENVDGARAESWFAWTDKVNFPGDATDPSVVQPLEEGVRANY
jgi:hypothetical protein